MKEMFKLSVVPVLCTIFFLLLFSNSIQAIEVNDVFGQITPPPPVQALGPGAEGISNVLNRGINLLYVLAVIIFTIMIIVSGLQMIMSGGDKEAVAGARKRLTWAIVGIALMALAFVISAAIGQILGFNFFNLPTIQPTPTPYYHTGLF